MKRIVSPVVLNLAWLTLIGAAPAADATIPGEVASPFPTLINLAVEWSIEGDDNLNGVVTVRYRFASQPDWRQAMPLRRVPAGQTRPNLTPHSWKNKHAGSIFDLQPNTEYEIQLSLTDPDGGSAERTVRARTRPVPRAVADGTVIPVTPQSFAAAAAAARPGDILLLGEGQYGALTLDRDGTPGRPFVVRGAAGAICESVSLKGRKHVHVERLTVKEKTRGYAAVDLNGAEDCVVRRCHIEAVFGVRASRPPGATNCYVADNVIQGVTPWTNEAMGANGQNVGEGMELTGPGNVICFNRVSGFRDCISTMESRNAVNQVCIDIYNNDILFGADDAIEADYAMGNCRIMRNRITNCFVGVSSQPGLGGPTYFMRNAMYNLTYVPYKLHNGSRGDVVLHNTVVKTGDGEACFTTTRWSHTLFRNNLAIGGTGGGRFGNYSNGNGLAANFPAADATCDLDYNGYGTVGTSFRGNIGGKRFDSLAALRANTSEKHAVQVGFDIFAAKVPWPDPGLNKWPAPDLRLKPGSAATDAGAILANVTDGYTGKAPDLGAYEVGRDLPHYGPRPEGVDEATR